MYMVLNMIIVRRLVHEDSTEQTETEALGLKAIVDLIIHMYMCVPLWCNTATKELLHVNAYFSFEVRKECSVKLLFLF